MNDTTTNTNRNYNYTKLQCHPCILLGINIYTNTGFIASNNNTNTVSSTKAEMKFNGSV